MSFRRLLYRVHLTVGLLAGVWLAVLGLSGAVLVFGPQLDGWLRPELLRVMPAEGIVSWDEMTNAVRQYAPHEPLFRIRLPQQPDESAEFWLTSNRGRRVYVDPYTGRILGAAWPQGSFVGVVRDLHTQLLIGPIGRAFVGACGLSLMVLCVSGLKLWWPGNRGWRRAFRCPVSPSRHVQLHLLHRSLGAVVALPLLVSAATGAALVFDDAAEHVVSLLTGLPRPASPPVSGQWSTAEELTSVDEALRVATAALSDAVPTWIWFPVADNSVMTVRLRAPGEWHPNGRNFLHLDAGSSRLLRTVDVGKIRDTSRVTNQFYPLHIGSYGGLGTRLIVLLGGIAPPALLISAVGSLWLRSRSARCSPRRSTACRSKDQPCSDS